MALVRKNRKSIIVIALFCFIAFWAMTPVVKESINQLYMTLAAMAGFLFITLKLGVLIKKEHIALFIYLAVTVLYKVFGISNETWAIHSNIFLYCFFMFFSLYATEFFDFKSIRFLAGYLNILLLFNLVYQFFVSSSLGGSDLYSTKTLAEEGIIVGGTSFVTVVMLFVMLYSGLFFLSERLYIKIFCAGAVVVGYMYMIFIQPRATATIVATLFIVSCLVFGIKRKPSVIKIIAFIIFIPVFVFIFKEVIFAVADSGNSYFARKFTGITEVFSGTIDVSESSLGESSFATRIFVATQSLKTWSSNLVTFLFGKGYDMGYYNVSGIGKHSELIDLLPKYGLFGTGLYFFMNILFYKKIMNRISQKVLFRRIILFFAIFAVLNGITMSEIAITMNCMISFTLIYLSERNDVPKLRRKKQVTVGI